ncbi:hypothetical protein E4T44_06427, partial [Aureobasidium sp. EXF-8845]
MQSTSEGKVEWRGDRLSYGDVCLHISQLRRMVSLLTPNSSEAGFSFVRLPRNGEILKADGSRWLLDRVIAAPHLQRQFFADRTSDTFKAPTVNQYIRYVDRFRTNLAVLCHITSGQPARATELLSIRHRNSYEGGHRGVYIDGGLVSLTTSYYKGSTIAAKADVNIIQRYLPETVGLLVVRYLWLVLPWIELLETQCFSRTTVSDHLWPDQLPGHAFNGDTFRTRFKQTTERYTGCKGINISSYRHLAIAISRRYLTAAEQFIDTVDASDEHGDAAEKTTNPLDAQASHSSLTLEVGRKGGNKAANDDDDDDDDDDGNVNDDSNNDPYETLAEKHVARRWALLRQSSPLVRLRELISPQAEFRSKQEEVLRAVYDGDSPILAIMPTGSGKSLSFILPASYEFSGTTIVVMPLLALQQDMLWRTTALSIPTRVWGQGSDDVDAKLVFVTPESARTENFLTYFHRLRTTGQIDRVVFDECHIFSDDDINFRPAIKELVTLFQFGVRLVFLTATLPVGQELPFWRLLGLQRVPVRTIRADTARHNLEYVVSYVRSTDRIAEIERHIQLPEAGKTIIYCRRKQTVITVAAQLGCTYYFSSYEDKKASLEGFVAAEKGIIVTTNALGLGIDIPDVRAVIHYDCPDSLVAYGQESGRAGRDGEPSRCILFIEEPSSPVASYEQGKRSFGAVDLRSADFWLQRYIGIQASSVQPRTQQDITSRRRSYGGKARLRTQQQTTTGRRDSTSGTGSIGSIGSSNSSPSSSSGEFHVHQAQERALDLCAAYGSDDSHASTDCLEGKDASYEEAVSVIHLRPYGDWDGKVKRREGLPSSPQGWNCIACEGEFLTTSLELIGRHVSKAHSKKASSHSEAHPLWEACKLQTVFSMSGDRRYFRVESSDTPDDAQDTDEEAPDGARAHSSATTPQASRGRNVDEALERTAGSFVSSLRTQRLQHEARATAAANVNPESNPGQGGVELWMKQLGLDRYVAGLHKDEMAASYKISKPEPDTVLQDLCDISDQLLRETFRWCQLGPEQRMTDPQAARVSSFWLGADPEGKASSFR